MNKVRIFAATAGALVLAALMWRLRVFGIAGHIRELGFAFLAVAAAGAVRIWVQTSAWQLALQAEDITASHWRLVAVRLASQATSYLACMGPVVSEPTKLILLRNPTGATAAAAGTLVETGMFWFTTLLLGLAGTVAAGILMARSPLMWVCACVFGAASLLLASRRAVLPGVVRRLASRSPKWLRSAAEVEQRVRSFRERHPAVTRRLLALEAIAQLLTLAEVAAVLLLLGVRFSMLHVLAIEAAGRMVKIIGAWIPGRLGADEGAATAMFALFGFGASAGLTLALARRLRDVMWCAAGVVWMIRTAAVPSPARMTQQPVPLSVAGD